MNFVAALLLLVLCSPLMLLVAIAIRIDSPGPVIFRQARVGLDRRRGINEFWASRRKVDYGGQLFTMYKFRTMYCTAGPMVEIWASPGDPRITRVGNFIRKYRLDELPQLWNVLSGDMNLIGPRPEQPRIFQSLRERIERYHHRQRVLPGITGWAQVNHRYDQTIDDVHRKVKLDLEYIDKLSIRKDLKILALTVPVVLFKRGAL